MPVEALNGIDLYYESHGEGPAITFLHGAAGNHISWWQQVPEFRAQYRCVTIDHRGFGASTDPEKEGGARYTDDLVALLDRLEIERTALVAQSMGGRTALGFAVRHPDRVSALVMADTWGFFDWPELRERMQREREQQQEAGQTAAPLVNRALAASFQKEQPALAFLYRQIDGLNPPREQPAAPASSPSTSSATLTREDVEGLSVPALFLVGSEDPLTPPAVIHEVHELVPGSHYVEIEGCGHSVYFERPAEFNEIVGAFLKENP